MKSKILYVIITLVVVIGIFSLGLFVADNSGGGTGSYEVNTPQFEHRSAGETIGSMAEGKAGIYYFGFASCLWCQELIPVFDKELKSENMKAFVVDTRADSYTSMINIELEKYFIAHTSEKRLLVPFIVFINSKSEIKTHIATVKGHNAIESKMTSKQKDELGDKLEKLIIWSKN